VIALSQMLGICELRMSEIKKELMSLAETRGVYMQDVGPSFTMGALWDEDRQGDRKRPIMKYSEEPSK
jgi:hypothetical protein